MKAWQSSLKHAARALWSCLLILFLFGVARVTADPATLEPVWARPGSMTIEKIGSAPQTSRGRLAFEDNLDCAPASFTLNGTSQTQYGCYMSTAFGGLDVENNLLSFTGVDGKTLPLLPYVAHEALIPWPGTVDLLALDAANDIGSYLSLYRNIMGVLEDQHNLVGQVTAKHITAPPDMPIPDGAGHRLLVNGNVLGFSDNDAWLVAETMRGYFVRLNLAGLNTMSFAPSFATTGSSPGLNQSQVAVSDDGRYVAIANSAVSSLRVYDLVDCPANNGTSLIACPSFNYWPFAAQTINGLQQIMHIRFVNQGLLSFSAVDGKGVNNYELAPRASIGPLIDYLAVGDSYTSGEGAYSYINGTDTGANNCHLSANSYPVLLTKELFTGDGGHSVACSGATSRDILPAAPSKYAGQVKNGTILSQRSPVDVSRLLAAYIPGNLPQSDFVENYQPAALTVSIGGNDVGFANILKLCVAPHLGASLTGSNGCYGTYEDRMELARLIDAQVPKLSTLFRTLQAKSPNTTIYIVGYPQIVVDNGNCALNVHLGTNELELSIEVINHLNASIAEAARASGLSYIDISQALAGHRLCETRSDLLAVNGLTAGNDGGLSSTIAGHQVELKFLAKESYHPNAYGQQLIAQAILEKSHHLQLKLPSVSAYKPATEDSTGLLKAPKSGRQITTKVPAIVSQQRAVRRGDKLPINVDGTSYGLKAKTGYTVRIGESVTTVMTNDSGGLATEIAVPGTTPGGPQEVTITGPSQIDEPITIDDVVDIIVADGDYDGDGLSDATEPCPTIAISGVDADKDGLDDGCDPLIGLPPTAPSPSSSTGASISASSPPIAGGSDPLTSPTPAAPQQAPSQVSPLSLSMTPGENSAHMDGVVMTSRQMLQPVSSSFAPPVQAGNNKVLGDNTSSPLQLPSSSHLVLPSAAKPTVYLSKLPLIRWLWWVLVLGIGPLALLLLYRVLNRLERRFA